MRWMRGVFMGVLCYKYLWGLAKWGGLRRVLCPVVSLRTLFMWQAGRQAGWFMAGRQGRNVPMQGVRACFAGTDLPTGVGTLGKTPKNRECAKGFAPPPSRKKSFSVWGRQRNLVVESKHSNHLVKNLTLGHLYALTYNLPNLLWAICHGV
jgi:hypothetical protein